MITFLLPKARNVLTGQTVKEQNLSGTRYTMAQRDLCQAEADLLAKKMSDRTNEQWVGFVEEYTPAKRK